MTYQIGRRPTVDADVREAIELLRGRSTGTLGHWTSLGYAHGVDPLVRPAHAVGPVVTARVTSFEASSVHYAVSILEPGDVLVIDTAGEEKRAAWGGGVSYAAYQAGAAGVIVDGPVTDWDEITGMGVQTWARGTSSITYRGVDSVTMQNGAKLPAEGGVNVTARISGTIVQPGDVAFADSDGVFFLPRREVLSQAKRLVDASLREVKTWTRLAGGERMFSLKGQKERYEQLAIAEEN